MDTNKKIVIEGVFQEFGNTSSYPGRIYGKYIQDELNKKQILNPEFNIKQSDILNANNELPYKHIKLETPLGIIFIDQKGQKENPDYTISINGLYLETKYTLEEAKEYAISYLNNIQQELKDFLNL